MKCEVCLKDLPNKAFWTITAKACKKCIDKRWAEGRAKFMKKLFGD